MIRLGGLKSYKVVDQKTTLCEFVDSFTGETFQKEIAVTEAQIKDWLSGTHIQYAMRNVSADDRELFLTGMSF